LKYKRKYLKYKSIDVFLQNEKDNLKKNAFLLRKIIGYEDESSI